jgi:ribosome-binding protein aMBF1 (putative translation factor)
LFSQLTVNRRIIDVRTLAGEEFAQMTVVEFRRRRRKSVERKRMAMHGTVEGERGLANGNLDRTRDGRGVRSGTPGPEMLARAEALARRIREHREAFACSQQEFAKESGISRATLSKIEQGHIYPSRQVRRKLAKALGVSPQELWNTRPESFTNRDEESTKQAS